MTLKNILIAVGVVILVAIAAYFAFFNIASKADTSASDQPLDATPRNVTLSGTFVCLPHLDTTGPQTEECVYGLKTDNGDYYAVDFGTENASGDQFKAGEHITADGFVVIKEALSSDHWAKYNMKGIFTITPRPVGLPQGKININAVCEGALAYMTFPDAKSADAFVAECKAGNHPEVIEQYKAQMGLGDGAAI